MSIIEYKIIYGMHELKNAAPPGMAEKGYALPAFENISEAARPNYYSPISPTKSSTNKQTGVVCFPAGKTYPFTAHGIFPIPTPFQTWER